MSDGADSTPAESPPAGIIDHDLPCVCCGYNLLTLAISGRCPECGTHVRGTLGEHWLRYDDPMNIRRLHRAIGITLIWLWSIHVGVISAFVLPAFLSGIPTIGGQAPPWDLILAFAPSSVFVAVGLILVVPYSLRVRLDRSAGPVASRPRGWTVLSGRPGCLFSFAALCAVLLIVQVLTDRPWSTTSGGRSTSVEGWLIMAVTTLAGCAAWLHALVVVNRLLVIENRCERTSNRRHKALLVTAGNTLIGPPAFLVLAWGMWLIAPEMPEEPNVLVMSTCAILGSAVLVWWLTICQLHRTRRLVASEIAAMRNEQ